MREIFDATERVDVKEDGTVIVSDARQINAMSGMLVESLSGDVAGLAYKGTPALSSGATIVSGAQGGIDFTSGLVVEALSGQIARVGIGAGGGGGPSYAHSWGGDANAGEFWPANGRATDAIAGGTDDLEHAAIISGTATRFSLSNRDENNISGDVVKVHINGVVEAQITLSGSTGFYAGPVLNLSGDPLLVQPGDELEAEADVVGGNSASIFNLLVEG